jgi:hypothetical protein
MSDLAKQLRDGCCDKRCKCDEAAAELDSLTARCVELAKDQEILQDLNLLSIARATTSEARVAALETALRNYGEHKWTCTVEDGCQADSFLAQIADLEGQLDAGREWMRRAWHEFNAIRARDGAPQGVSEEWWSEITDALGAMLGDDTVPWMTQATTLLVDPLKNQIADLEGQFERANVLAQQRLAGLQHERTRAEAAEGQVERLTAELAAFDTHHCESDGCAVEGMYRPIAAEWAKKYGDFKTRAVAAERLLSLVKEPSEEMVAAVCERVAANWDRDGSYGVRAVLLALAGEMGVT